MYQSIGLLGLASIESLFERMSPKSVCMELTMRLANTSITKAAYNQTCQVETYVKFETQS